MNLLHSEIILFDFPYLLAALVAAVFGTCNMYILDSDK